MTLEALIGLIMLVVLLGAIFIGVPISFTLLFLAFAFGYLGMGATVFDLAYLQTIGMMKEELLAAVPLFIFMGFITEQAGLMERLFIAFRLLLAPSAARSFSSSSSPPPCSPWPPASSARQSPCSASWPRRS